MWDVGSAMSEVFSIRITSAIAHPKETVPNRERLASLVTVLPERMQRREALVGRPAKQFIAGAG